MQHKCLFLDFDGVLNNIGQMVSPHSRQNRIADEDGLDQTAIGILRWIIEMTDASIVISSTWRYLHKDPLWFIHMFEAYGWDEAPVVDITPDLRSGYRGDEIQQWLDSSETPFKYVIVDDDSDMLFHQPFVNVNAVTGLTLYDAIKIIDILGVLPEHKNSVKGIRGHTDFVRDDEAILQKMKERADGIID